METPSLSIHHREIPRKSCRRKFYEAFVIGEGGCPTIGHAVYNLEGDEQGFYHNTLYLNLLSSLRGHLRGRVNQTLGIEEGIIYKDSEKTDIEKLDKYGSIGEILVKDLIHKAPPWVKYISIPVNRLSREALMEYYQNLGKSLKKQGLIQNYGFHDEDSVFLELTPTR